MKWSDLPRWMQEVLALLLMLVGAGCMGVILISVFGDPGQ